LELFHAARCRRTERNPSRCKNMTRLDVPDARTDKYVTTTLAR
jgi:hypothetical protein